MKKLIFGLILFSGIIQAQNFNRIDDKNINQKQKEFAQKFVKEYFAKQTSVSYYQFTKENATDEMISGLSASKQHESSNELKSYFGDLKFFEYSQVWIDIQTNLTIYRFKGTFSKNDKMEIRVVLNNQSKIAGFFVKPWMGTL